MLIFEDANTNFEDTIGNNFDFLHLRLEHGNFIDSRFLVHRHISSLNLV